MRHFTPKEDRIIQKLYLTTPAKRIAKKLGRVNGSVVRQRMRLLGLTVPPEIAAKFKALSQFKPGHSPANKGKRQSEYMTKEAIRKTARTRFKKGDLPKNTKSDGFISVRTDKAGRKYQWVRVSLGNWKMLHVHIWEKKYGKVKPGHIIVFKNGDQMDTRITNLECITRQENMIRNSFWTNLPKPLARIVQLRGALNRKINKLIKNEKQNHRPERPHVRTTGKAGRRIAEKRRTGKGDQKGKSHQRHRESNRGKRKNRTAPR